jgi:hypothetical protein
MWRREINTVKKVCTKLALLSWLCSVGFVKLALLSWLCLQAVVSVSKQQNHLRNAMDHVWRWLNVNRPKHVVCQQHQRYFHTNSVKKLIYIFICQQLPLPCRFVDSSLAVIRNRKWPRTLKILSVSFCYFYSVSLIHEYF